MFNNVINTDRSIQGENECVSALCLMERKHLNVSYVICIRTWLLREQVEKQLPNTA